ncbi:MAG: hypothetical protein ABIP20_00485 [Chthoniobacteraceae bacterium]
MFVRKKTKLRIAYGLLTLTSLSVFVYDAEVRSDSSIRIGEAQPAQFSKEPTPLPITPLAESPFPEARPGALTAGKPRIARMEPAAAGAHAPHTTSSGVYFLTVAVQVPAQEGLIELNRGTRVRLVREQDGKFLVRRNGSDFLIEKTQVTDDSSSLTKLARNSS